MGGVEVERRRVRYLIFIRSVSTGNRRQDHDEVIIKRPERFVQGRGGDIRRAIQFMRS
jgi:hypothetical protein